MTKKGRIPAKTVCAVPSVGIRHFPEAGPALGCFPGFDRNIAGNFSR